MTIASPEGVRVRTMVMVPLLPVDRASGADLVDNDLIRHDGEEHAPVADPQAVPAVASLRAFTLFVRVDGSSAS